MPDGYERAPFQQRVNMEMRQRLALRIGELELEGLEASVRRDILAHDLAELEPQVEELTAQIEKLQAAVPPAESEEIEDPHPDPANPRV